MLQYAETVIQTLNSSLIYLKSEFLITKLLEKKHFSTQEIYENSPN